MHTLANPRTNPVQKGSRPLSAVASWRARSHSRCVGPDGADDSAGQPAVLRPRASHAASDTSHTAQHTAHHTPHTTCYTVHYSRRRHMTHTIGHTAHDYSSPFRAPGTTDTIIPHKATAHIRAHRTLQHSIHTTHTAHGSSGRQSRREEQQHPATVTSEPPAPPGTDSAAGGGELGHTTATGGSDLWFRF